MAPGSQGRLVVRKARLDEHPALAHLAVGHIAQPYALPLNEAHYRGYFSRPDVDVFVAEVGGRRAGMVVASEEPGFFSSRVHVAALVTEPEFRSSTVASRLMRHVVGHSLERNATAFIFEAEHRMAERYLAHLKALFPQAGLELVQTHSLGGGLGSFEIRLPGKPLWRRFLNLLKRIGPK